MNVPENSPVWQITEPSKEFKAERCHDLGIIDSKIAKLEELIEGLSSNPSPKFVGGGTAIINVDTSGVRQKYETMLVAEEKKRKEALQNKNKLNDDYQGFEERVAFVEKAKDIIREDSYIMEEILSHNSGEIYIGYYNCEPERDSLEQIVSHISEQVETPPEIIEGKKYLTYHIKAESGKDLFLIYSEDDGFKILKDDFSEQKAEEVQPETASTPVETVTPAAKDQKPEEASPDYKIDKLVYQLIFDSVLISFPNQKEWDNTNFYRNYSKLKAVEDIKEKLSKLFDKLSISGSKDSRTMMASSLEHQIVTVFNQLVKKTSIKTELKKLENWLNDDKTLDKKSMSGTAIATHNATAYDARKSIEGKEEPYRLYSMIVGYHHYFDSNFPYVVDALKDKGDSLPQQRKKDSPYFIKPCPPVPLFKELKSWRNETLRSMLLRLRDMKLRGAKNAEKERIVKSIQVLAGEMEMEAVNIEEFNSDKLLGKDHFEEAIIEFDNRIKALSH